jgi:hypothetical protein
MPGASVDFTTLAETAKAKRCALGLTVGAPKHTGGRGRETYRELDAIVVAPLPSKALPGIQAQPDREPIVAGDFNGAATRLLRRVRQH